jgi:hypothetical protein
MEKARDRLVPAAAAGLGILVVGLVMLVGPDDPHGSRVGTLRRGVAFRPTRRSRMA